MSKTKQSKVKTRTREEMKEILKCVEDINYFAENYMWIPHPTKGLIPFKPFDYQKEALRAFQTEQYIIVNKSRQLGFSTVTMVYSLWLALFEENKNIVSIATKLATAKNYISRLRESLKKIPPWLMIAEKTIDSKIEIGFSNGSSIKAVPTSASSNRGDSLSVLILDECVNKNTIITLKNKETDEVIERKISELYESFSTI